MDKSIKLTFRDIEVIMKVLEKEKVTTTDQAKRQMIEEIIEDIKKTAF